MSTEPGELLEYQTQQEPAYPPLVPEVRIAEPVVTVAAVAQHITCRTYILDTGTPYMQILPQDPLRVRARLVISQNGVVICHSLVQAQDPANTGDINFTAPNGAYVQASNQFEIASTEPLWISTSKYPAKVAVISERRGV
jgi:hypothetical protein